MCTSDSKLLSMRGEEKLRKTLVLVLVFLLLVSTFSVLLPKVQAQEFNFGKTDIGSSMDGLGPDQMSGSKFTLTETGIVEKISVYVGSFCYGSGNSRCAIYDCDGEEKPDNKKLESAELSSLATNSWNNFTVSPGVELSAGDYWILFWSQRNPELRYDTGGSNVGLHSSRTYGTWPDPWTTDTTTYCNHLHSMYATYTTGPRIIYVDPKNVGDPLEDGSPEHPFDKIQEGINAASDSVRDTVFVYNGTCKENVVVNKTVSLIGENRNETIIDGNGTGTVVRLYERASVSSFTIRNGTEGVHIFGPFGIDIIGNNITNNDYGIVALMAGGINISGNNITANNADGVNLFKSGGIVSGNNITNNNGSGVSIFDTSNNIYGNNITNNGHGISVGGASRGNISGNNITNNNGYGVSVELSASPIVSGNYIANNSDGVILSSVYCTIFNNTITENNDGIRLEYYLRNNVSRNILIANYYGIFLNSSNDNTLVNNTLVDNTGYGIYLDNSSNNTIAGNNFLDNTVQANATQSYNNAWNSNYTRLGETMWGWLSASGGNYWSDYDGTDLYSGPFQNETGNDGIGDTPYGDIDADNTDYYPLMYPTFFQLRPPTYFNWSIGTNTTVAGEPCLFHAKWSDDAEAHNWNEDGLALSGFIFSTNNTGIWENRTWEPLSGYEAWSNKTEVLNSTVGVTVAYQFYCNDTYNNWNVTRIHSLITTPPPKYNSTISLLVSSSPALVEYEVNIVGTLTCQHNGSGIPNASVQFYRSVMGVDSIIALTTTNMDGSFSVTWFAHASGDYIIKAVYAGDSDVDGTETTVNLIIRDIEERVLSVSSNSTVSSLTFNSTSRVITFTVSGPSGTMGYANIFLSKDLVSNIFNLKVYLDGVETDYEAVSLDDVWFIHLSYHHSSHTIRIALPTASPTYTPQPLATQIILIITLVGTLVIASIFWRKKFR